VFSALDQADNWPLVDTEWLASAGDLTSLGPRCVAGRDGAAYDPRRPASFFPQGSDRTVLRRQRLTNAQPLATARALAQTSFISLGGGGLRPPEP
jgi:hypothetical protein